MQVTNRQMGDGGQEGRQRSLNCYKYISYISIFVDFVFLFLIFTFFPSVNDNSYLFQHKVKFSNQ